MVINMPLIVRLLYVTTILVCLALVSEGRIDGEAVAAKTCMVNLDQPPVKRWSNFTESCGYNVSRATEIIKTIIKSVLKPPEVTRIIEEVSGWLDKVLPLPYADELRGISKLLQLPLGDIVLLNLLYDITAFGTTNSKACTSIVALDQHNRIIHGRNLDYQIQPNLLRELTIQVNFMRNKKSLFMATTYVGYIGVITGCRHGAFTISGDERDQGELWRNILTALNGGQATFFAERMVLEKAENYVQALELAINTPTIAPVYFILGGIKPEEGCIVVKDSGKLANVTLLGGDTKHPWYIVETNYDPWVQAPATDDRRDAAINAMNKLGRKNMNSQQLYKVLSVDLVFNSDTTYTTIMSAADASVYQTMIRYDAPPPEDLINT